MALGDPTYFVDLTNALTPRTAEVPAWNSGTGMDWSGSCSPGIGINIDGGAVVGEPQQFTLNDQDGAARQPQVGQNIGGLAFVNRSSVSWPGSGGVEGKGTVGIGSGTTAADGAITPVGDAWLDALATGWTQGDPTP